LSDEIEEGWEGCLSVPGCAACVPLHTPALRRLRSAGQADSARRAASTRAWSSTNATTSIGILYPMRMRDFRMFGYTEVLFPDSDARDE
jgi:peptide deformylase